MRNKVLEESANSSIEKIHDIESSHLEEKARNLEEINSLSIKN